MGTVNPPRPLSEADDRTGFDCGRPSLDHWFHHHAWRNQVAGVSRTNVLTDAATGAIVGYVTLSAAQIEREALAAKDRRNRPDPIPVVLLGQLAIDHRRRGEGHARSLMYFALTTVVRLSTDIGCFGVVTHPLDDEVRAFYRRFGFRDVPYDRARSMIVRIADLTASGF